MRLIPLLLSAAISCHASTVTAQPTKPKLPSDGLNLNWMNIDASPDVNFFIYANGAWQKKNPIPEEYASWNAFNILQENILDFTHDMLQKMAANPKLPPNSIEQKVADFYASGMDEKVINEAGLKPIQPLFDAINDLKKIDQFPVLLAKLQGDGVNALFWFGSMQDFSDSNTMIAAAVQGGLGLPDRDYYVKDDEHFKKIRKEYVNHIAAMFQLAGDAPDVAAVEAKNVLAIETMLANASLTRVEQRDPRAIYHMMNLAQLNQVTPQFSWENYFKAMGLNGVTVMNLGMPEFFKMLNSQLTQVSIQDWKTYLRWHVLDAFASYLPNAFVEQNFKMSSILTGAEKLQVRWKRVINTENAALGFAIGKLYVEKKFSPDARKEVLEILSNIRKTLRNDLQELSWMTPQTRKAAIEKLDAIEERVGYPDKWWDYSTLQIDKEPYVLNVIRANQFLNQRDLNKIGKPVDRSEWAITPQTINAYYDPSMNNINIPAGILQPPFFDPKAPAAVNYGAIGFVIGHEITHGFDDQGAQFDAKGNLRNWWTPEDLKKFKEATTCIAQQYSQYKLNGNMTVQGQLVVGEATADLGGLMLAYRAFHSSNAYKNAKPIAGFSPDQQFFLGFAHVWAGNIRDEEARQRITTDPHPPMYLRVNGTLANMPQYHKAFLINQPGAMRRAQQCVIW